MTELYRVLYCSRLRLAEDHAQEEVRQILAASRRNNTRDGITGGLLFSAGSFAQVLEGPVDAVEEAFERIQCDPRHDKVTVLEAGPVDQRAFPDWSMAFKGVDPGVMPLVDGALSAALAGRNDTAVRVFDLLVGIVTPERASLGRTACAEPAHA